MTLHRRNVPIAVRCEQDWGDLRGDEGVRGCERCQRQVTNLSLLSEREARAFLRDLPAGQCIAYQSTLEGTLRFREPRRRLPLLLAGALLMGGCPDAGSEVGALPALAKHEEAPPPSPAPHDEEVDEAQQEQAQEEPLFPPGALVEHAREDAELDCETVRQLASLGYFLGPPGSCEEEE